MPTPALISCDKLVPVTPGFDYAGNSLSLDIGSGDIACIVGTDYSGKSDWLGALAGVNAPREGRLELLGKDTNSFEREDWIQARRNLAYVRSDTSILSAANALQNVILPARYHGLGHVKELVRPATELLHDIGVSNIGVLPAYLRRDQRLKVAVARAMILQPSALILDNPFAILDADATYAFQNFLLRKVRDDDLAILMVTHDVNFAIKHSKHIVFVTQDDIHVFDENNPIQSCGLDSVQDYLDKNRLTC